MSNIFELTSNYKEIIEMADQLDEQTLDDMLEAIEGTVEEKVASMIAVVKSVKGELEVAKDFKKSLDGRMKSMNNTIARLNDYILLSVDTIGKPKKGAEQFKKLEIKDKPWVKSAWTQFNPPSVEVVDDRIIDSEFKIPQPDKVDTALVATKWKEKMVQFEENKTKEMEIISQMLERGDIDESEADQRLEQWVKDNKHNYEIKGIEVKQSVGIRYR